MLINSCQYKLTVILLYYVLFNKRHLKKGKSITIKLQKVKDKIIKSRVIFNIRYLKMYKITYRGPCYLLENSVMDVLLIVKIY